MASSSRDASLYPPDRRGSDSPQFGECIDDLDTRLQGVEESGGGGSGIGGVEDPDAQSLTFGGAPVADGWDVKLVAAPDGNAEVLSADGYGLTVETGGTTTLEASPGNEAALTGNGAGFYVDGSGVLHLTGSAPLQVVFDAALPTADPVVAGALWNNSGMLQISAG